MGTKSIYTAFILKALFVIIYTTAGFSPVIKCDGQSVVGKWNEVSVKQFFTPAGTKQTGNSVIEKQIPAADKLELEFKSDSTYIEIAGHIKFHTTTGTWSVSGNQLTMIGVAEQRAGMEGRIYTFSITGITMTRTMLIKPPYNTMVYKQEDTSIKM